MIRTIAADGNYFSVAGLNSGSREFSGLSASFRLYEDVIGQMFLQKKLKYSPTASHRISTSGGVSNDVPSVGFIVLHNYFTKICRKVCI